MYITVKRLIIHNLNASRVLAGIKSAAETAIERKQSTGNGNVNATNIRTAKRER